MRSLLNKKGQSVGGLFNAVLIIAAIGILIALVMYIMSNISTSIDTDNVAASVSNELGFINSSGYTLDGASAKNFGALVISSVTNTTSGVAVTSGNWTVSSGVFTNATAVVWPAVNITYTYTYTADTAASNATQTIVTQFVDFLPWLAIILLVVAAGVVLFFVIRSFSGGPRGV